MKLYTSIGPNPAIVKMFLNEKGVQIPMEEIDIRGGANRKPDFLKKNPSGTSPALELSDGTIISEVTAICEYVDEVHPGGNLIGATPNERAQTRMWTRRIDLGICEPMANGFRYSTGLKMFQDRMHCIPEAAEGLKTLAQTKLAWLDEQLQGRDFLCGDRFSMADIVLFCMVDFFAGIDQPLNDDLKNVKAWHARVKARPSAAA
ncbi:MAG: glutathione S-transferase family protein [Gammaproteobacteria bacterium]|nr:glutathione S-transferase family protein [Gammaproteobacteria bacterium]